IRRHAGCAAGILLARQRSRAAKPYRESGDSHRPRSAVESIADIGEQVCAPGASANQVSRFTTRGDPGGATKNRLGNWRTAWSRCAVGTKTHHINNENEEARNLAAAAG